MLCYSLHMFPYKFQIVPSIEDRDSEAYVLFDDYCSQNIQTNEFFLSRVINSDECVLHVDEKVESVT